MVLLMKKLIFFLLACAIIGFCNAQKADSVKVYRQPRSVNDTVRTIMVPADQVNPDNNSGSVQQTPVCAKTNAADDGKSIPSNPVLVTPADSVPAGENKRPVYNSAGDKK
jgi:hypothetical protein